jgi:hypothetical protein
VLHVFVMGRVLVVHHLLACICDVVCRLCTENFSMGKGIGGTGTPRKK